MAGKPVGGVPRNAVITIRVTESDKQRFTAAAARDGKDLSDWLRWLADTRDAATGTVRRR
jgi:hypothetical protein